MAEDAPAAASIVEKGHRESRFNDGAPPPDKKQRELIFDSLATIFGRSNKRGGRSKGSDNRGTYLSTWGAGYHGQLGRAFVRGQKKYSAVPLLLDVQLVVRQVTCGGLHTACVTESGEVYTWGDGRKGQLGFPQDPSLKPIPRLVDALSGVFVMQVACGGNHTVALTDTGVMYSWGWAKNGQTGHGDRMLVKLPKRIDHEDAKEIICIAAGNKHTACVNKKGEAITFGCSDHGQTGLGNDGTSVVDALIPTKIASLTEKMTSVACGSLHTCFISDKGEVFLAGFGEYFHPNESQHFFYDPKKIDMPEPIAQISCGQAHNIALSTTGNVYTWGSGDYGQLGHGIFGNFTLPRMVLEDKNMAQVAAGRYHSFALSNMGVLYAWGCGENGQLGLNSDENIALPTMVNPILGSVVGQVACGEHHTAVISSAPWGKLSANMAEWAGESRVEHEKKQERLKKTHRGLTRKDLQIISKEMERWNEQQQKHKEEMLEEEKKEQQRDITSIALETTLAKEAKERKSGEAVRTMKLPSVTDARPYGDMEEEEEKKGAGAVRLPKVKKRAAALEKTMEYGQGEGDGGGVDTSEAAITRTAFLKETAMMVRRMKAVVADKGEGESNRYLTQMMRLVFELRTEYDKLKNHGRNKSDKADALSKEFEILLRGMELGKDGDQDLQRKLKELEMQLNTVTIKIAETSENRRNYELNIAHLKEEDFEHFNQLKGLRKQAHENNNFFKKMNEIKIQALEEKEKAEAELIEFRHEIESYQQFVQSQLGQFEQILDIVRQQNENRELQKQTRNEKLQARINLRIEKLEAEAEAAEKEASGLTSRLTSLDLKLRHFEDSFQKITAATGLTNPNAIVNKFQFKGEIKEQLQKEIDDKQARIDELRDNKQSLQDALAEHKFNFKERTWRDVNNALLDNDDQKSSEGKTKQEMARVNLRLAMVQESILTVFKSIARAQDVDLRDFSLENASLWDEEQTEELFAKLGPSLDELVENEQMTKRAEEAEAKRRQTVMEEVAKTRQMEHGETILGALGIELKKKQDAASAAAEDVVN